jgi:hypothetical protein
VMRVVRGIHRRPFVVGGHHGKSVRSEAGLV